MADKDSSSAGTGHNSKNIDFEGGAKLMQGQLTNLRTKGAKVRGDQSAAWNRIEEMGLNKKASKAVFALMDQGAAEVSDYLRTFIGLLGPLELGIMRDMVDDAEGKEGIMVPLIDPATVEVEGEGSVATKAMKETAATQAAAKAKGQS